MSNKNARLRSLPSVSALLATQQLRVASARFGQPLVSRQAKQFVDQLRENLKTSESDSTLPDLEAIACQIAAQLDFKDRTILQPVINATGVLLHTGLGRSPLAAAALEAAVEAGSGYCNVELDLASGERSQRAENVADLLCELTGAEAAHVVNNNAGATALVLAALATNREVIVSHGELIEIGGGYRLPEVIETFGACLCPVGTTNKTRVSDYEQAIGEQTGALLVVHPSNYQVAGFTASPPLAEIAEIARQKKVPLVHDIGSGAMIDFAQFGCQAEPVASASVQAGADLVLWSGDKLLGGPQAGIIVGGKRWIDLVVKHPLNRALRVDKVTLAALRATLGLYRHLDQAKQAIPLLQFLSTPVEQLKQRAEKIADKIHPQLSGWDITTAPDQAFVGGGSVPQQAITSWCLAISSATYNLAALARELRLGSPAIVPRTQRDQVLLGMHGVFPSQDDLLPDTLLQAMERVTKIQ